MTRKESQHRYYLRHRADFQINGKNWYRKNRERVLERQKRQYRILREVRILNRLLITARHRAKKLGLPFNLSLGDLKMPKFCPVFKHKFELGEGKACIWSPTLDRRIPKNGYVKGNVQVISLKANSIKGFASLDYLEFRAKQQETEIQDLKKVIRYLRKNNT